MSLPPTEEAASGPREKPLRLFTAVDLGDAVLGRVSRATAPLHARAPHAKWVAPASMHLTLFFFGWVAPSGVAPLEAALAKAAKGHGALTLEVRGGGAFGTRAHPRVLWLGLEGEVERLAALQASVVGEVTALGFKAEARPFAPHLTLARARDPRGDRALADCRDALAALDAGASLIDALVLYQSELSPRGARYTALQRYPLAARR
jgi:2'-5' RNA ligase